MINKKNLNTRVWMNDQNGWASYNKARSHRPEGLCPWGSPPPVFLESKNRWPDVMSMKHNIIHKINGTYDLQLRHMLIKWITA
jgi:hypothetical protein